MNDLNQISKQYHGFLKTPQLFKTEGVLNAKIFQTDELIEFTLIDSIKTELSRQKYLGKRAELFLLQYLKSSKRYHQITHSFQIQDDDKTIGELDVICFDQVKQKWIHIELVFKFYVFVGDTNYDDFTQWIGPNLKDRLDYKIDKLKSHQLPLGQHQSILEKIGSTSVETYSCYKAKLFLRKSSERIISNHLNSNCLFGYYLNFEDFKSLRHSEDVFYVPDKQDWLCEAKQHSSWFTYDKAETLLKSSIKEKRSRLVWQKNKSGEVSEYFVVWW